MRSKPSLAAGAATSGAGTLAMGGVACEGGSGAGAEEHPAKASNARSA